MTVSRLLEPLFVFVLCYFCVFSIFCVLVFLRYCDFMLSVPVQLIVWKDRPRNDLLCVERDIRQLLSQLLSRLLGMPLIVAR